jgi:hypothetical protein
MDHLSEELLVLGTISGVHSSKVERDGKQFEGECVL